MQKEYVTQEMDNYIHILCKEYDSHNRIEPDVYSKYPVKRGLRNSDGTGVMAGVTQICNVHGYVLDEGERFPVEGHLTFRGIDINDLINGCQAENRYGYEETAWLLLFGSLPTHEQLDNFNRLLAQYRELPEDFVDDMIIKAPSPNIMNKLARSILALYSYDANPDDTSLSNVLRQCIELIARTPSIITAAYQVRRRAYERKSMYFHTPNPEFSTAQNILRTLRSDKTFTEEEAHLLDLCLILHAEHGGGNNSTFTTRVLTSSGTDTYSAIAAGVGSLKGPKHGGANLKVLEMLNYMKEEIADPEDENAVREYLVKLLTKQAGDHSGLIYGMGHAVYTLSDPRSVILKKNVLKLSAGTEFESDVRLLSTVERLTPGLMAEMKGLDPRTICSNVDLYSGIVYRMLRIPPEVFTPLFATARMAGWCAHRLEELTTGGKIMRPAYKAITTGSSLYVPLDQR